MIRVLILADVNGFKAGEIVTVANSTAEYLTEREQATYLEWAKKPEVEENKMLETQMENKDDNQKPVRRRNNRTRKG
jgi:hypothetical protein